MIRVLLADDQPLIRGGIRALLDAEDDIEVVAEGANGAEAVRLVEQHVPDVAFLDVEMPVMTGIEACRRITANQRLGDVHVVMLTNYGFDEYVYEALRSGASGFLVKDTEPADLVAAVHTAARGDALLSPVITRKLIGEYMSRPLRTQVIDAMELLTDREREVVALVARGMSNDEIAAHLVITPATAKTHVSRAMTKLDARDRAQLVVTAFESGLVIAGGDDPHDERRA